jgi:hypothetical protein
MKGEKAMRKSVLFVAVFLMTGMVSAASLRAMVHVHDYEQVKHNQRFKTYIDGVGTGCSVANVALVKRKQPELYCPPANRELKAEHYLQILEEEFQRNQETYTKVDAPVEIILLKGLQKTFPCGKK